MENNQRQRSIDTTVVVITMIFVVGLALRLWHLDARAMHHDESLHAFYSLEIAKTGDYQYTPFLHGPLLYYLNALVYVLLPIDDYTSRLLPAIAGAALILLPLFLRTWLTNLGAILASILIAVSPTMLYFSRFLRHDIYSEFLHATALIGCLHFIKRKQSFGLIVLASALTLSFANHELTYMSLFMLSIYLAFVLWRSGHLASKPIINWIRQHQRAIAKSLCAVIIIYVCLFSSFFSNLQGLADGLPNPFSKRTSLGYWLGQHEVNRGSQKPYYYIVLMLAYEFLPVLVLFFGTVTKRARALWMNTQLRFLCYWAIASFCIYSWAGERMPWLLMHPLMPMLLLCGVILSRSMQRKRWWVIIALTPVFIFYVFTSLRLNFQTFNNPVEMMAYVQSSQDVVRAADKVLGLQPHIHRKPAVLIDKKLTWPFAWYLRNADIVDYPENLRDGFSGSKRAVDAVMIRTRYRNEVPNLGEPFEFAGCFSLRDWWVPKTADWLPHRPGNIARLANWFFLRHVDEPPGYYPFCLYRRNEGFRLKD